LASPSRDGVKSQRESRSVTRRVHVAVDEQEIRPSGVELLLNRHHDLLVCLAWDPDPTPRFTSARGIPSSFRMSPDMTGVVVLSRMDDGLVDAARREGAMHRCRLHEVGAGSGQRAARA